MGLPPPSPLPEFVYKITPEAPPQPIPEQYPLSALDQQDGFVHLSTSWQVSYNNIYYFRLYLMTLRCYFTPACLERWRCGCN